MSITIKNYKGDALITVDADHLRSADLSGANLSGADLRHADLRDADLRDADLSHADLRGADLRHANLSGAILSLADLSDADLRHADLRDADLRDADLSHADLRGADLTGTTYGDNVRMTKPPVILTGMTWPIMMFDNHMKIGCQLHSFEEWFVFNDRFINDMDSEALAFWSANKAVLFALAESTGRWKP